MYEEYRVVEYLNGFLHHGKKRPHRLETRPLRSLCQAVRVFYGSFHRKAGVGVGPSPPRYGILKVSVYGSARQEQDVTEQADLMRLMCGIVRRLLEGADGRRWWSLSRQLKVLPEAAPDVFLEAVDDAILLPGIPIMEVFREDQGPMGGAAHHAELLWGLEMLAWSPRYLGRVAEILARMDELDPARIDPGSSRYANRPAASLRQVFCLWLPQTYTPLAARLRVLAHLRRSQPAAAWRLLLGLLPTSHDIGSYNPQPRWRDFAARTVEPATTAVIIEGAQAISQALLEDVGVDVNRWKDLMDRFPDLAPDLRGEAIQRLAGAAARMTDPQARAYLWATLRDTLHGHREYPDAGWSLPSEELDRIEQVYQGLEPSDPIERVGWLFVLSPKLPHPTGQGWQADADAADQLRCGVVRDLLGKHGPDGVFTLAHRVEAPGLVGKAVGDASVDAVQQDTILIRALRAADSAAADVARGMIMILHHRHGDAWVQRLVARAKADKWDTEIVLRILLALPASKLTWDLAESFGSEVAGQYWQAVGTSWIVAAQDERAFVVTKLLAAERARQAVYFLGHELDGVPSALLVRALSEAAAEPLPQSADHNAFMLFRHDVEQILRRLDQAGDVAEEEIARLEWLYLPWLRFSSRPPIVLHRTMASKPEFFRDVVLAAYPPAPDSGVADVPITDERQRRAVARQAADLLESFGQVPGATSRAVNGAALEAWVTHARLLCAGAGRAVAGDYQIGRMLAHAPIDADGVWPAIAVRDVIQIVRSRDLEKGVVAGVHEQRGVTTRDADEGGTQERALAQRYRESSQAIALEWPRAAAVLENIAVWFEAEARWHDEDVVRFDWAT